MAMRWLHFRIDEQLHERARRVAAADRRSLSNWVALAVERAVEAAEAARAEAADRAKAATIREIAAKVGIEFDDKPGPAAGSGQSGTAA
jgi:hypothetical protein